MTTLESPLGPYVAHYPLLPRPPAPAYLAERLGQDSAARVAGRDREASPLERHVYEMVLLDTLVHELNTVRGLLGEPDRLEYVSLAEQTRDRDAAVSGGLPRAIHWIDLPGIARYTMEFALYAPDRRVTLSFPSPFLRGEPAVLGDRGRRGGHRALVAHRGDRLLRERLPGRAGGVPRQRHRRHAPVTSGRDGLRDIALCQAIIECHRPGRAGRRPTAPADTARKDGEVSTQPAGCAPWTPARGRQRETPAAGIAVANAPVSYGAFEITVGHDPNVPDGTSVLDQVAAAGYAGIDLGPVGYLGRGARPGGAAGRAGLEPG